MALSGDEVRGQWAKKCGQPSEVGKVKKKKVKKKRGILPDSLQKGTKPCGHLHFSPVKIVSDIWLSEL